LGANGRERGANVSLEKFKYVDLGETQYRIGRLTPAVGSYILGQIMSANLRRMDDFRAAGRITTAPEPTLMVAGKEVPIDSEGLVRAAGMAAFLGGFDLDTHAKIQQLCLAQVSEMTQNGGGGEPTPMPIATANGTLLPHIAIDMALVMRLEMEVLVFNLTDFFAQGGLSSLTPTL
jgi:hypothetical protein